MSSNDQSKLMNAIGIGSDSLDSSSSDDIIPMQRRSKQQTRQRAFSKRRYARGSSPSSSIFFKSNYSYGVYALAKIIFFTFVVGTLTLCLVLSYSLYNRLQLLQTNLDGLQSSKSNLPEEMHIIHSHLKVLDQNSTQINVKLAIALESITNLTTDIVQIQAKLQKITDSIEAAPTIAQLPKDVEDLKKVVADLGSKIASDDKEVKLAREQQVTQDGRMTTLENKLKLLESNISIIDNRTIDNGGLVDKFNEIYGATQNLISNVTDLRNELEQINISQKGLDKWRLEIENTIIPNHTSSKDELNSAQAPSSPTLHTRKKNLIQTAANSSNTDIPKM
ncbi:hypothetical protein RDWZM_005315 [Blomia tropicalis]|uniref:Uncharacterized protein n=1 Tax=Blomia tropicalis TaxID=40697 RepID=A0A9Q0RKR8_BLOTA|nr:hypothetical protein RDWZM_005315 [Blomia tropicalis]